MRKFNINKKQILVAVFALLAIAWTVVIFCQSAKNGEESTEDTESVMEIIENIVEFIAPGIEVSSHAIRKLAHFGEYLVLGVLGSCLAAQLGDKRFFVGAWGYAVAVALFDEFLVQRFSEGRSPQFTDVLIDSSGALVGCLSVLGILYLAERAKGREKL